MSESHPSTRSRPWFLTADAWARQGQDDQVHGGTRVYTDPLQWLASPRADPAAVKRKRKLEAIPEQYREQVLRLQEERDAKRVLLPTRGLKLNSVSEFMKNARSGDEGMGQGSSVLSEQTDGEDYVDLERIRSQWRDVLVKASSVSTGKAGRALEAEWVPEEKYARVTKAVGKQLLTTGFTGPMGQRCLYPEEVLYLVDGSNCILYLAGEGEERGGREKHVITRSDVYPHLLAAGLNLDYYNAYSLLRKQGFIVRRYCSDGTGHGRGYQAGPTPGTTLPLVYAVYISTPGRAFSLKNPGTPDYALCVTSYRHDVLSLSDVHRVHSSTTREGTTPAVVRIAIVDDGTMTCVDITDKGLPTLGQVYLSENTT